MKATITESDVGFSGIGDPDPVKPEQVQRSQDWIALHCHKSPKVRSGPLDRGSYGWKHDCENARRAEGVEGREVYVSNGAFIVAALRLGYAVSRNPKSPPNCFFNMTRNRISARIQSLREQIAFEEGRTNSTLECYRARAKALRKKLAAIETPATPATPATTVIK